MHRGTLRLLCPVSEAFLVPLDSLLLDELTKFGETQGQASQYLAEYSPFDLVQGQALTVAFFVSQVYILHCKYILYYKYNSHRTRIICLLSTLNPGLQVTISQPTTSILSDLGQDVCPQLPGSKQGRKAFLYDTMMVLIHLLKCLVNRIIYIPDFDGQNAKCLPVQLAPHSLHGLEQLLQVPYSRKRLHITPHH